MTNISMKKQGFAAMSQRKRREIARKGGMAAHMSGNAHILTPTERSLGGQHSPGNFKFRPEAAKVAGRIGGRISRRRGAR